MPSEPQPALSGCVGYFEPPADKWYWRRTLLERAGCIALTFEPVYLAMWPGFLWPLGLCLNSSLTLAPAIRMSLEWEVRIAIGLVRGQHPHAWVESPDGDIIDPTYCFDGQPYLRVLLADQSTMLGHQAQRRLSIVDEERIRRSLRPFSSDTGWAPDSGVIEMFGAPGPLDI